MLDDKPRVRHRLRHDRERELALGDLDGETLRRAFGQPQRHARRDVRELGDERRDEPRAHGADHAEGRVPGLQALQHRQVAVQRVELAADRPCPLEHLHAELGGHRAPAVAHDQLHAEIRFELAHVLGHVGLHGVEAVGRGREGPLFGHRQEGFELPDVHGNPSGAVPAQCA